MKEKLTSAINFALQNKISEMSCDISDVMKNKIKDKIAEKKKKVAEDFMGESEAHEVKLVESRYNRDVDFDDEGWGVENPRLRKPKYGQNNPYEAPPMPKIYHNVPFKQKEEAKAEGMKFDGTKKKWYHTNPESSKNSKFSKLEESLSEMKMTSSEKSKEKKLKLKYDSSDMKQKMIDQYGPEKGKSIYFATIRKKAMKEDEEINEALSIMTLKKHYYQLPSGEFKKQYGHPKHVIARIFGWSQ